MAPTVFRLIVTLAMVTGVLASSRAALYAWEEDVHHVLTLWLAIHAGFELDDAQQVADGNQGFDDSLNHTAIATMARIYLIRDKGDGQELQAKHFPSDIDVPSPPQARGVVAGSSAARRRVSPELTGRSGGAGSLRRLGEGLHPFQDSWSHQGVPDVPTIPPLWPSDLSSAHPVARGGWSSHEADWTHLHVDELVDVARETYEILRRFLELNPNRRAPSKPTPTDWFQLEPIVRDFAQADDKQAKEAWAVKHLAQLVANASNASNLIGVTTLPGPTRQTATVVPIAWGDRVREVPTPPALIDRAEQFLDSWVARASIGGASEYVDVTAMGARYAPAGLIAAGPPDGVRQWVRKTLAMYWISDHALVSRARHADPKAPGYSELPEGVVADGGFVRRTITRTDKLTPAAFSPLFDAGPARPAASQAGPARPAASRQPTGFAMALAFTRLSHDGLLVIWEEINRQWMITGLVPLVG